MDSSIYPMIVSLGVLGFDLGLLLFMVFGMLWFLLFCIFYLFFLFVLWMKDVVYEDVSGQYSYEDYRMFRQGFRCFLFSELALFFTVFWCFFDSSVSSLSWVSGDWVPGGVLSPDYIGLNALASSFLMMNSQLLKYSRRFLFLNYSFWCENLLLLCIFVGGGFICFQMFEYNNNPFCFSDSIYGSVFYMGTGLHGFHVMVGIWFLIFNYYRLKFGHFNWYHSQSFDMSIDYWRFLEWMWGLMFCLLYIWGS